MKRWTLVEVTWRDSASHKAPWRSIEEGEAWAREDLLITTVGYFFERDTRFLTLVQSHTGNNGAIGGLWQIPLGCIVKTRRLK